MLTRKKQVSDVFDTPHGVCCDFTKPAKIDLGEPEKMSETSQPDAGEPEFVTDKYGKNFPADQYFINPETGRANKIK